MSCRQKWRLNETMSNRIKLIRLFTDPVCCRVVTRLWCDNMTPLGSPVVPLEKGNAAMSLWYWMSNWSGNNEPSSSKRDDTERWPGTGSIVKISCKVFNTLRPIQNWRHFPDDMFKCIFLNENVWISIEISLKFFPTGPVNNIPAMVQIMAWRRPGDKLLSEPMMVRLPTHICGLNGLRPMSFMCFSHQAYVIVYNSPLKSRLKKRGWFFIE